MLSGKSLTMTCPNRNLMKVAFHRVRGSFVVKYHRCTNNHQLWTHMLNTVDYLPRADLQNIDTRATSAKDVFLIFADLEKNRQDRGMKGAVKSVLRN